MPCWSSCLGRAVKEGDDAMRGRRIALLAGVYMATLIGGVRGQEEQETQEHPKISTELHLDRGRSTQLELLEFMD